MKLKNVRHFFGALCCVGAALSSWSVAAVEQPSVASKMEGVWKISTPTPRLLPADGSDIPFTEEGLERFLENKELSAVGTRESYDEYDISKSRCSTPGVPRLMINPMRFKIWNRLGVMTFDFEWNRAIRQVDLRGGEVKLPLVPNMNGVGSGQSDGKTLVVETVDISDQTLIDDLVPHSAELKVTERYRLKGKNTLENRITINDPVFFTEPWEAVVTYKRQANVLFPEDVCMDRLDQGLPAFPEAADR